MRIQANARYSVVEESQSGLFFCFMSICQNDHSQKPRSDGCRKNSLASLTANRPTKPPSIVDLPEFGGRFSTSTGEINGKEGAQRLKPPMHRRSGAAAVHHKTPLQTHGLDSQMLTKGGVICQQAAALHKLGLAFCMPDIETRIYVMVEHRNKHHHDAQRDPHANRKRRDTKQVVE